MFRLRSMRCSFGFERIPRERWIALLWGRLSCIVFTEMCRLWSSDCWGWCCELNFSRLIHLTFFKSVLWRNVWLHWTKLGIQNISLALIVTNRWAMIQMVIMNMNRKAIVVHVTLNCLLLIVEVVINRLLIKSVSLHWTQSITLIVSFVGYEIIESFYVINNFLIPFWFRIVDVLSKMAIILNSKVNHIVKNIFVAKCVQIVFDCEELKINSFREFSNKINKWCRLVKQLWSNRNRIVNNRRSVLYQHNLVSSRKLHSLMGLFRICLRFNNRLCLLRQPIHRNHITILIMIWYSTMRNFSTNKKFNRCWHNRHRTNRNNEPHHHIQFV